MAWVSTVPLYVVSTKWHHGVEYTKLSPRCHQIQNCSIFGWFLTNHGVPLLCGLHLTLRKYHTQLSVKKTKHKEFHVPRHACLICKHNNNLVYIGAILITNLRHYHMLTQKRLNNWFTGIPKIANQSKQLMQQTDHHQDYKCCQQQLQFHHRCSSTGPLNHHERIP